MNTRISRATRLCCLCLGLLLLISGCQTAAPAVQDGYTFTDDAGVSITAPRQPKTVAVLLSSFAEIWQLAGGEVAITVGESVERGFVDDTVVLVDSGAGKTIDVELLVAQEPDLVICSADLEAQSQCAQLLNESGIPAAQFHVDSFEDYLRMLRVCTELTGNPEAYETYGTQLQGQIDEILASCAGKTAPRILFVRAGSSASSVKAKRAEDHFAAAMLEELGAQNLADEAPVLLDGLSLEAVLLADPEQIFLVTMGDPDAATAYIEDLFAQDGWRELTAVQTGNYTFLPKDLFHYKPNARWAEAYAWLADLLYPDAE